MIKQNENIKTYRGNEGKITKDGKSILVKDFTIDEITTKIGTKTLTDRTPQYRESGKKDYRSCKMTIENPEVYFTISETNLEKYGLEVGFEGVLHSGETIKCKILLTSNMSNGPTTVMGFDVISVVKFA